ncbi:MAG: IPT/TIG domain-containing protein, partial [Cyanobacteria bacterium NC_groundwater_1444_Ag_S-0.65um_54_12]|nr:IPT/TIG domain-containing protein [Cyanobacteria bacterium NC_groundwater_1444_Ag_S-0.65um_54_12]
MNASTINAEMSWGSAMVNSTKSATQRQSMSRLWWPMLLLLCLGVVGCPPLRPTLRTPAATTTVATDFSRNRVYDISGRVAFGAVRQSAANLAEVATGATVSLIDAVTGETLGTSVTTPEGKFLLSFGNSFVPKSSAPYYLEAVKGLSAGGNQNRAGASAARVRTIAYYDAGNWKTITAGGIVVGRSSTALAIIDNLRSYTATPVNRSALVGSVTPGTPDATFRPGGSNVAQDEYRAVYNLVTQALAQDEDPVYVITYNVSTATYNVITRTVGVSDVLPAVGRIGATVTVLGNNFSGDLNQNQVLFNGTVATSSSVNSAGTQITVAVPVGATSGPLKISVGSVVFGGSYFTVLPWDGHLPFDTQGNLYVAGSAVNTLFRVSPSGVVSAWLTGGGLTDPAGITVDAADNVYVANRGSNNILKITPDQTVTIYASGAAFNQPAALALSSNGQLYVANRGGRNILLLPPGGGAPSVYFADASLDPASIAFDGAENLWVSNPTSNQVQKLATGSLTLTSPVVGLNQPYGIAFDSSGNLFIANYGENSLLKYTPGGALLPLLNRPGGHLGLRLVAFNTNGVLYGGAYDSHTIFAYEPTGAIRQLALAPRNAWGIAMDSAKNLYIGANNFTRQFAGRAADDKV